MSTRCAQRTYDHRLVRLVQETGDTALATRLGVPRSTAAGGSDVHRFPSPRRPSSTPRPPSLRFASRASRSESGVSRLFLNRLDSAPAVERLVAFCVEEYNARVPHSAFDGQTPDEMYFGTGGDVPAELAAARAAARRRRLEVHRSARCGVRV